MKTLVIDTENTIFQKGNPFARRNRCCYLGLFDGKSSPQLHDLVHGVPDVPTKVDVDCIVGFNLKYDLHWLRRLGIQFPPRVHCCQLAHYLLTHQKNIYPSLQEVCEYYGIAGKLDGPHDFWNRGVDTPDIPRDLMLAYLEQDLRATWNIYQKQQEELEKRPEIKNLMRLHMDDLLVLQDMEWNGLRLNLEECKKQEQQVRERIGYIEKVLSSRYPNTPINWDSGEHVSAYLYGGTISVDRKEPAGLFKTGARQGQVRYRHVTDIFPLPRLVEPPEGSNLKKEGLWSTAEDILKSIKPQIGEIALLLERAGLSKLLDYLHGWPELMVEMDWNQNEVHGQFNQVVTRTGRLSSSRPNLQNVPDPMLQLIESRYDRQRID